MIRALLLAALLVTACLRESEGREESKWCRKQREKCEDGCPKDSKVKFSCEDRDGQRSVSCACASNGGSSMSSSSSSSSSGSPSSSSSRVATHASTTSSSSSSSAFDDVVAGFGDAFAVDDDDFEQA